MPLYITGGNQGGAGQPPSPDPLAHLHSGWEIPVDQGDRQTFRATHGNYQSNTLEVAISAVPEGEEGFSHQFPPTFVQTSPSQGLFRLNDALPPGWEIIAKYVYK